MSRSLAVAFALSSSLAAQIFIVDAANGPGTHFLAIDTAVAAVPDGSVLIVRAGSYASFTITGKGLTIVGEPGAAAPSFTINNTAASQPVVVRDFVVSNPPTELVTCTGCQGALLLQRVAFAGSGYGRLVAQQCAQIAIDQCGPFQSIAAGYAMEFGFSSAVCTDCDATGGMAGGILVQGGTLQLIDCHVTGGVVNALQQAAAIDLSANAQLRLAGAGSVTAGFLGTPFAAPAIAGSGTVRRDPGVAITGGVNPNILTTEPLAWVTETGGPIGTVAAAAMSGPAGHLGVLLLGTVGAPVTAPGIANQIWLAPGGFASMAAGVFGPPLGGSVPVPSNSLLLGTMFAWQGITLSASGALAMTNPALFAP